MSKKNNRNEFRWKRNKDGKIINNETPFKGEGFVKNKRIMARLDAQLRREEETRKAKKA